MAPDVPGNTCCTNLLSWLQAILEEAGHETGCGTLEVRRRAASYADVRLFFQTRPQPAVVERLANTLDTTPGITSVKAKRAQLTLRLDDSIVEELGRDLEEGLTGSLRPPPQPDTRRFLMGFLGPNTCKALHLGHLRNIVVGHAMASAFRAAGLDTRSYSLTGDIGRNVCEALAGWQLRHPPTGSGNGYETGGVKADHFFGECYARYLDQTRDTFRELANPSDPCGREQVAVTDLADTLLQRWRTGDPETRRRWRVLCREVMQGHEATLRRLGVTMDRHHLESDHVEDASSLLARGVRDGILEPLDDGRVVYDTGREEFPKLVLRRSDGFPTEHARVLAVFAHIFEHHGPECVHIDWNGTEWQPAQSMLVHLLEALDLVPAKSIHRPVFHGMVEAEGEALSSSRGEPLLIDEMLDRLESSAEVAALVEGSRGAFEAAEIAALVLKAFFLSARTSKPLVFSPQRLADDATHPCWNLARAWCRVHARARTPEKGAGGAEGARDPHYRFAVLQAQGFPAVLEEAIHQVSPLPLVRFVDHFASVVLASPPGGRLDRLARTVLHTTLGSLGLLPHDRRPSPEPDVNPDMNPQLTQGDRDEGQPLLCSLSVSNSDRQ